MPDDHQNLNAEEIQELLKKEELTPEDWHLINLSQDSDQDSDFYQEQIQNQLRKKILDQIAKYDLAETGLGSEHDSIDFHNACYLAFRDEASDEIQRYLVRSDLREFLSLPALDPARTSALPNESEIDYLTKEERNQLYTALLEERKLGRDSSRYDDVFRELAWRKLGLTEDSEIANWAVEGLTDVDSLSNADLLEIRNRLQNCNAENKDIQFATEEFEKAKQQREAELNISSLNALDNVELTASLHLYDNPNIISEIPRLMLVRRAYISALQPEDMPLWVDYNRGKDLPLTEVLSAQKRLKAVENPDDQIKEAKDKWTDYILTKLEELSKKDLSQLPAQELEALEVLFKTNMSVLNGQYVAPYAETLAKKLIEAKANLPQQPTKDQVPAGQDKEKETSVNDVEGADNADGEIVIDDPEKDKNTEKDEEAQSDDSSEDKPEDELEDELEGDWGDESIDLSDEDETIEEYYNLDQITQKTLESAKDPQETYFSAQVPSADELLSGADFETTFQDIKKVVNAILIEETPDVDEVWKNKKKRMLSNEEKAIDMDLFYRQIYNETSLAMAGKYFGKPFTVDDFAHEYADRLRLNLINLVGVNQVARNADSQTIKNTFANLSKVTDGENIQPVIIDRDSLIGYQAFKTAETTKANNLLAQKTGSLGKGLVGRFAQSIQSLDQRLTARYGKKYAFVKNTLLVSGAYGLASAISPVATTVVAGYFLRKKYLDLKRDYEKEKVQKEAQMRARGQQGKYSFMNYWRDNKFATSAKIVAMALTCAGPVASFQAEAMANAATEAAQSGVAEIAKSSLGTALNSVRSVGAVSLGLAQVAKNSADTYKHTQGTKMQKWKAVGKSVLQTVASFAGGFVVGHATGEAIGAGMSAFHGDSASADLPTEPVSSEPDFSVRPINEPPVLAPTDTATVVEQGFALPPFLQGEQADSLTVDNPPAEAELNLDPSQPADGVSSTQGSTAQQNPSSEELADTAIDLNHLTSEQEHDLKMLTLRDPQEASAILGKDHVMSSAEFQKAWNDGTITDEQKIELLKFADQRFDSHGHFQDVEGYPNASEMEHRAQVWTAQHQSHHQSSQTNENAKESNDDLVEQTVKAELNKNEEVEVSEDKSADNTSADNTSAENTSEGTQGKTRSVDAPKTDSTANAAESALSKGTIENVHLNQKSGDLTFEYKQNTGHVVKMTLASDGTVKSLENETHGSFSRRELASLNKNPAFKEMSAGWYQDVLNKDTQNYQQTSTIDFARVLSNKTR